MRYMLPIFIMLLIISASVSAQDADEDISATAPELVAQLDEYGQQVQIASGEMTNSGQSAYGNINVYIDVYDASGQVIGEGFGYKVNQCGQALTDTALQPGQTVPYSATIDLFADGAIDRMDVIIEAEPVEPAAATDLNFIGLRSVSDQETVMLEWIDDGSLRYAVGCDEALFLRHDWYEYTLEADQSVTVQYPRAEGVNQGFIDRQGLNKLTQDGQADTMVFERSFMTFDPNGTRFVYQTDLNTLISMEANGDFRRVIVDRLYQYSLQGFIWRPEGRFLAYYFGAFGEPVRYFMASAGGQMLSAPLQSTRQSVTVPGPTEDGRAVVIGGDFGMGSGYYLNSLVADQTELLFEAELPGNNWPAPVPYRTDDQTLLVYVVRPVDGQATLECFDGETLHTLTPLPIQLQDDERAWSWPAPDYSQLAIGANGRHGGLWLVDLNAFEQCR